jgi:hypothetical protein
MIVPNTNFDLTVMQQTKAPAIVKKQSVSSHSQHPNNLQSNKSNNRHRNRRNRLNNSQRNRLNNSQRNRLNNSQQPNNSRRNRNRLCNNH